MVLDVDESLLPHFRRPTVTEMDEHRDTTSSSFGRKVNAAAVSVPKPLCKILSLSPTSFAPRSSSCSTVIVNFRNSSPSPKVGCNSKDA